MTEQHFGINCIDLELPMHISQFTINVSASLFDLSCAMFLKERDLDQLPDNYLQVAKRWQLEACEMVPTVMRCKKSSELVACFVGNKLPITHGQIFALCRRHLGKSRFAAGFRIQHCSRRCPEQNKIIIESTLDFSFSKKKFAITRTFPLNINAVETAKKRVPIFLIDFGNKLYQSALREKTDGIELLTDKDKEDTIGAILPSIVRRPENGCRTKSLHFIPPADTYTRVFFQLAQSGVSVLVNREKDVKRYENNPNITSPSRCDVLGDDCQPTRELLLKAEQLLECCSPSKHYPCTCGRQSIADISKRKGDPLQADDVLYTKEDAQEMFDEFFAACSQCYPSLARAERRRQKRQAKPKLNKWTKFPIPVKFTQKNPREYIAAIQEGNKLISKHTCVKFTTDLRNNPTAGITVVDDGDTWSKVGKKGGWQQLSLGQRNPGTVVHELLHAIGIHHEHQRNDARNFIKFVTDTKDDDWKANFEPKNTTENFGFAYDFASVMHYRTRLRKNSLKGMVTLNRFYMRTTGQRERPTFKDLALINRIYCNDKCKRVPNKCQNGGYLNPLKCWQCLCPVGFGGIHCEFLQKGNCEDLANASELEADWQTRVLKPRVRCVGPPPCTCFWRIKAKDGNKLSIKMIRLDATALSCSEPCGVFRIEIKFRKDKRASGKKWNNLFRDSNFECFPFSGAWLCCAEDIARHETKNWIEAEGRTGTGEDIIISSHIGATNPTDLFELTYETGGAVLVPSAGCPQNINWNPGRNPKLRLFCHHPLTGNKFPCKCFDEEENCAPISNANLECEVLILNGHYREMKGENENSNFAFECLKRQGDAAPFWAYWNDKNSNVPIHIDDLQCLRYEDVGIDGPPKETTVDYLLMKRIHYNRHHFGP
ncbi:hypothetical protein niasHS_004151 [Heterodera schachtii]|uniref:Metalloendopeptidase n=1 Tax=Heterodera schachtii TaxID=97005 RepID=A0ABD2JKS2_HETSC